MSTPTVPGNLLLLNATRLLSVALGNVAAGRGILRVARAAVVVGRTVGVLVVIAAVAERAMLSVDATVIPPNGIRRTCSSSDSHCRRRCPGGYSSGCPARSC